MKILKESFAIESKEWKELSDKYMKPVGKSDSIGGELIRAVNRIGYRYYNDGDKLGFGYGNETTNYAARYIQRHGSSEMKSVIDGMWDGDIHDTDGYGCPSDLIYRTLIDALIKKTIEYLQENPSIFEKETEDMDEYTRPYDTDYDNEEDWWEDEEDDW